MGHRIAVIACAFLSFAIGAAAQESSCASPDIAINVIKPSGEAILGLSAGDFTAQMKKQALSVQAAKYDSSPRRILLVMDDARELKTDGRQAEIEFASGIISSAQPGDSIALIRARGARQEVKFGADRATLLKAVTENGGDESHEKQLGVMDAVAEGIGWFGEPRVGDAIVLMAMNLEGNHATNHKNVAKLLAEHRIRLFGVALGHLQLTNDTKNRLTTGREGLGYQDPGMPMWGQLGDANFLPLSVNSGGYVIPEDTLSKMHEYKLTDKKKQELQKTAENMAGLIDQVYALQIAPGSVNHSEPWTVSLSEAKLQGLPGARVLYPHELGPCPGAGASH